jgi:hypothetical protein
MRMATTQFHASAQGSSLSFYFFSCAFFLWMLTEAWMTWRRHSLGLNETIASFQEATRIFLKVAYAICWVIPAVAVGALGALKSE